MYVKLLLLTLNFFSNNKYLTKPTNKKLYWRNHFIIAYISDYFYNLFKHYKILLKSMLLYNVINT